MSACTIMYTFAMLKILHRNLGKAAGRNRHGNNKKKKWTWDEVKAENKMDTAFYYRWKSYYCLSKWFCSVLQYVVLARGGKGAGMGILLKKGEQTKPGKHRSTHNERKNNNFIFYFFLFALHFPLMNAGRFEMTGLESCLFIKKESLLAKPSYKTWLSKFTYLKKNTTPLDTFKKSSSVSI